MQEETRLKIDPQILKEIKSDETHATSKLKTLFELHFKEIQDLLFNYHYDKRERVYDLNIEDDSVDFDGNKGSFKILYMIGFFNACADLDYNAPEKMRINFSIDSEIAEIYLIGEYWTERGQDEI